MSRAARIGILCVSVAIFCYAAIGRVLWGRTADDKAYKSLTVYSEVLQKVQQDYVDDPNLRMVTAGSLHGMLESLDAQSSYLTPREYEEYKKKVATAGTGVKVGVIRRGKATPEEVDLVREKLATPKIIVQKVDPDILVLRVPTLDAGRADEIRNRLLDAEKQGVHKVILDVRECGRGPVSEAISIARLFLPSGTLTTLRGQTVSTQVFSAEPKQVIWKSPVAVLVDATTSGAAEVLASAIVANHRGDVVGERTFGLASEQKLITLDDGAALILTVANYYNPGGKSILEEGVTPTEVVRAVPEDDSDVADEEPAPAPQTQKEPGLGPRPLSPEDPIFHRALDLLKTPAKKAA